MKAHLVGGGLASMAAATYMITEGGLSGEEITIYEAGDSVGGSLGLAGSEEDGFVYPGGRVFERQYRCTLEFFDLIPSRNDRERTIKEDIDFFNEHHGWKNRCRLIDRDARVVDTSRLGLTMIHLLQLFRLLATPERIVQDMRLRDCFSPSFFDTNFWYIWSSIMAFVPEHGAMEARRYLLRFFHILPQLSSMEFILRTRFHQQQSIVDPVAEWLRNEGVRMRTGALVEDLDLKANTDRITVQGLVYSIAGEKEIVPVAEDDLVLVTNGSQLADMTLGTMDMAPPPIRETPGREWTLWKALAEKRPGLGNPSLFADHTEDSTWVSFTATTRSETLMKRLEKLTRREAGRGGLVTLRDSSWLITFTRFHDPNLVGQEPETHMIWGYGFMPDRVGHHVKKPLAECTGREILTELLCHLQMAECLDDVLAETNCRPCRLPHAGSMLRRMRVADRPRVIPENSTNLAFIGQFAEQPEDVVFTMEYSVRSARNAVSALLGTKPPPPVYRGILSPKVVAQVIWATLR